MGLGSIISDIINSFRRSSNTGGYFSVLQQKGSTDDFLKAHNNFRDLLDYMRDSLKKRNMLEAPDLSLFNAAMHHRREDIESIADYFRHATRVAEELFQDSPFLESLKKLEKLMDEMDPDLLAVMKMQENTALIRQPSVEAFALWKNRMAEIAAAELDAGPGPTHE